MKKEDGRRGPNEPDEEGAMARRSEPYEELEGHDLPCRDRPYESFGQQGLALSTYGEVPIAYRGAERVDLGEPVLPAGPKNWQRSDDRIQDDLCGRLTDDSRVDASDIEVIVHHGEVTLSGTVPDRDQRERAYHLADSVRGVVDVIRRLRVARRDEGQGRDDAASGR